MERGDFLVGILIVFGAMVLLLSTVYTRRIFKLIPDGTFRSRWRVLSILMIFFFIGYIWSAALVFAGKGEYLELLTGVIFLSGAIFVLLVVQTGHASFGKMQKTNLELEKRGQELESKNREMEQFSYITSHDLQEPLKTVNSLVELLEKEYGSKLDSNADRYLKFISESSNRMSDMIKGLLDFSRIGTRRLVEDCDLNDILMDVQEDLGKLIDTYKASIIREKLPVIQGYRIELRLLFQNLISNAIKFSVPGKKPRVEIAFESNPKHWTFSVKDNGIGIDEKHQKKIFQIFQRLHGRDEYEGTGIGLSFCKKIIDFHQGEIWVRSQPQKGSTFYFSISKQLQEWVEN